MKKPPLPQNGGTREANVIDGSIVMGALMSGLFLSSGTSIGALLSSWLQLLVMLLVVLLFSV
jgi:hypothetical protein